MAESKKDLQEVGVRFQCDCGTRLLIAARYVGKVKHCPKCEKAFTVPAATTKPSAPGRSSANSDAPAPSAAEAAATESADTSEATCAICHCSLLADDVRVVCPACGLPYHDDCWKENFGCSAYGCAQVNVLKPGPDIKIGSGTLTPRRGQAASPRRTVAASPARPFSPSSGKNSTWEVVILAVTVAGFFLGLLTYGVPCFLSGITIVFFVFARMGLVKWRYLIPAAFVVLLGIVLGIVTSSHLYSP